MSATAPSPPPPRPPADPPPRARARVSVVGCVAFVVTVSAMFAGMALVAVFVARGIYHLFS